ncbi:ROK family protein [Amycolatopsis acidicola]|uniref:ROK family protein n=1 Tax=Amycolatopsis acidicola TaxID=2596893 RepID=A0A5N0V425_9PSEU|nr:ROK family protein [Amycolatopsis acidicola]KAA9160725.1 ROK family protein [Amycolatopsis acidicola]
MADHTQTLSLILTMIRSGMAVTRPELVRQTGLGRTIVTQRVDDAMKAGILAEGEHAPSTGGRPSRTLCIAKGKAVVLAMVFGATRVHAAVVDLDGTILVDRRKIWDIETGPEESLATFFGIAAELLTPDLRGRLWGVCVGVPGPVDFARGVSVAPPIMRGWDGFPIRERIEDHFGVPAWVDNDVNLMTLGAWSATRMSAGDNLLLVKAGTGIGMGLISRGRLHRGARGSAGDFGHTIVAEESRRQCRCGKFGCLEAFAGGWALTIDARNAALTGRSVRLAELLAETPALNVVDLALAAADGDLAAGELIKRAGELIGAQLANVVSVFNPSTVYLAGSMSHAGPIFRDTVAEAITRRSLPLATDNLAIANVTLDHYEGVIGAAALAVDELLHPVMLGQWLPLGAPHGVKARKDEFTEPFDLDVHMDFLAAAPASSASFPPASRTA